MHYLKLKNIVKMFVVCGVVTTLFLVSVTEALADKVRKVRYSVDVIYLDCYDNNGNPTGKTSRTETWTNSIGQAIYQEYRDCDGKTSTSGKKPIINADGTDLWGTAAANSALSGSTVAAALAMDYTPEVDSVDANGQQYYEFEFALDWVYNYDVIITPSSLVFTTDFDGIYIKLVDLTEGTKITDFILVNGEEIINLSALPTGCRYSLMMFVFDAEEETLIPIADNYNFCR